MTGLRKPSIGQAGAKTGVRAEVIEAFENNDHAAIRRLGWWTPWQALHDGWAPKRSTKAPDMVRYARRLGDLNPEDVADAVLELPGEWPPVPAEIQAFLRQKTRKAPQANTGLSRDPAATPEALKATAAAVAAGAHICECTAPTLITWDPRPDGVLRCADRPNPDGDAQHRRLPGCGGLQRGQVYDAEDAGYTSARSGSLEATGSASVVEGAGGAHVA